ncbi:MAG: flagellar basal-body rod protein FlgG [Gemmatimonadaceae bacterium]|nr:flagellar basal-body rod protein FlgG [Gemmatimonadaceae bacterium]
MDPALRAAASGMRAQQTRQEVIANNLANVNTTGYKRSRANFEDLLYQTVTGPQVIGGPAANTLPAVQIGRGVRLSSVQKDHAQGSIETTQNPMDIAIEGEGFFQIQLPSGAIAYSRDGKLQMSDQGVLVTAEGNPVLPNIKVPPQSSALSVGPSGIVSVMRAGSSIPEELGRIELARFSNPAGMLSLGQNMYSATPASGEPMVSFPQDEGTGRLQQGALEMSNVEVVTEMVDMITTMRAYELTSKSIKTSDDMLQIANGLVR